MFAIICDSKFIVKPSYKVAYNPYTYINFTCLGEGADMWWSIEFPVIDQIRDYSSKIYSTTKYLFEQHWITLTFQ